MIAFLKSDRPDPRRPHYAYGDQTVARINKALTIQIVATRS
ncbi:MAG: hypothetical protein ACREFT_17045 [Acetobacteraceae bacterium]